VVLGWLCAQRVGGQFDDDEKDHSSRAPRLEEVLIAVTRLFTRIPRQASSPNKSSKRSLQ
jgi:hypothetical protein